MPSAVDGQIKSSCWMSCVSSRQQQLMFRQVTGVGFAGAAGLRPSSVEGYIKAVGQLLEEDCKRRGSSSSS